MVGDNSPHHGVNRFLIAIVDFLVPFGDSELAVEGPLGLAVQADVEHGEGEVVLPPLMKPLVLSGKRSEKRTANCNTVNRS